MFALLIVPFRAAVDPRADELDLPGSQRGIFFAPSQRRHLEIFNLIRNVAEQMALAAAPGN
jgi:hypothetical protein